MVAKVADTGSVANVADASSVAKVTGAGSPRTDSKARFAELRRESLGAVGGQNIEDRDSDASFGVNDSALYYTENLVATVPSAQFYLLGWVTVLLIFRGNFEAAL